MAFLCYARADDNRLGGLIGALRHSLPELVGDRDGRALRVVEDRDATALDLHEGEIGALAPRGAAFFVPLLSPRFFASGPCRQGLLRFLGLQRAAERHDLVLPLYLETVPVLASGDDGEAARLERVVFEGRYRDWRHFVDGPFDGPEARRRFRGLADEMLRVMARGQGGEVVLPAEPAEAPSPLPATNGAIAIAPGEVAAPIDAPASQPASGPGRGHLHAVVLGVLLALLAFRLALLADPVLEWSTAAKEARRLAAALTRVEAERDHAAVRAVAADAELARRATAIAALESREVARANELAAARAALAASEARLAAVERDRATLQAEIVRLGERLAVAAASRADPHRPGTRFRDCPECPEMVVLPGGAFEMGSTEAEQRWIVDQGGDPSWSADERPRHEVRIAPGLAVSRLEITRGELGRFVAATGHRMPSGCRRLVGRAWRDDPTLDWRDPGFAQDDDHPAVCVGWADATAYAAWIGRLAGRPYRLLSEAEWEHAARAGAATARYWGDDPGNTEACAHANGLDGSAVATIGAGVPVLACSDGAVHTAPVGGRAANAFGLHDMLGNVAEWVEDCYQATYEGAPTDGTARIGGDCARRVTRGGSFLSLPRTLRAAARNALEPDARNNSTGFRLATTPRE